MSDNLRTVDEHSSAKEPGDLVFSNGTVEGTQTGAPFTDVPPSGGLVVINGTAILRMRDGKIVERWAGPHGQEGLGPIPRRSARVAGPCVRSTTKEIAVIGTGCIGGVFGYALSRCGSRHPHHDQVADGPDAAVMSIPDVLDGADAVILAVPGPAVAGLVAEYRWRHAFRLTED